VVLAVLPAVLVTLGSSSAWARGTVRSGTSGYERIGRGVIDLGLDNTLLSRYSKDDQTSSLNLAYFGGITGRYFLADNLGLGLSVNGFYQQDNTSSEGAGAAGGALETTASDRGIITFAMVDYYLRLGHSFFLKPGLGGGFFYGWRTLPTTQQGVKLEHTLVGGAGRLNLGVVYYAGAHLNLKAGADVILRVGNERAAETGGEDLRFTSVEAGFGVGVGYSF
jgi:hypothetical protein